MNRKRVRDTAIVLALNLIGAAWLIWLWASDRAARRHGIELEWLVGFAIAMVLSEPILMVLHELSHAVVGRAVGLRVFGISLGTGPRVYSRGVGKWTVEFRVLPAGGSCRAGLTGGRAARWRVAAMIAAGPVFHLIVLLALLYAAPRVFEVAIPSLTGGAFIGLFLINLLLLSGNLLPRNIKRDGQVLMTDGKNLLRLWRSKDAASAWVLANHVWEISACLERGSTREARYWLERTSESCDVNALAFRIATLTVMGAEGNWTGAAEKAGEFYATVTDPMERASVAAWEAVSIVYSRGDLKRAEALCDELVALVPWEGAVQAVFAVVALARGADADAGRWLREARTGQLNWAARAAGAWAWAEIFRRKGAVKLHHQWGAKAAALDPIGAFRFPVAQ
jgi:hypothetical protein